MAAWAHARTCSAAAWPYVTARQSLVAPRGDNDEGGARPSQRHRAPGRGDAWPENGGAAYTGREVGLLPDGHGGPEVVVMKPAVSRPAVAMANWPPMLVRLSAMR